MIVRRIPNDEIYHHGVKGMRWGHRKQSESTGGRRKGSTDKGADREKRRKST